MAVSKKPNISEQGLEQVIFWSSVQLRTPFQVDTITFPSSVTFHLRIVADPHHYPPKVLSRFPSYLS